MTIFEIEDPPERGRGKPPTTWKHEDDGPTPRHDADVHRLVH